jgi:hypothetical protein
MTDEVPSTVPAWYHREIIHTPTRQPEIDAVKHVQRVLHCPETGEMDDVTRMHIKGMQMLFGLQTTGSIDAQTAEEIDRIIPTGAW